jgi:hypothetical protein
MVKHIDAMMQYDTIGTRMTRIGQIFTDFFYFNNANYNFVPNQKIRENPPIRVIRVPIVSQFLKWCSIPT